MTASLAEGLFGWMNRLVEWLFSLGMQGKLSWISEYWPALVLVIAIFCVIMDFVVWMLRYKPYRRWKRIWDSLRGQKAAPVAERPTSPRREPPRPAAGTPPQRSSTLGATRPMGSGSPPPISQQKSSHTSASSPPVKRENRTIDAPTQAQPRPPLKVLDAPTRPIAKTPLPKDEPSTRE